MCLVSMTRAVVCCLQQLEVCDCCDTWFDDKKGDIFLNVSDKVALLQGQGEGAVIIMRQEQ